MDVQTKSFDPNGQKRVSARADFLELDHLIAFVESLLFKARVKEK